MKILTNLTSLCAMASIVTLAGCGTATTDTVAVESAATPTPVANTVLCGACGHEKGSAVCCADACEVCEKCGLHVGSSLCCAVSDELEGKDMCATCGHEAGSEACCADDCDVCEKCGLHADSPLCCALTDTAEDTHVHADGEEHEAHQDVNAEISDDADVDQSESDDSSES